MNYVDKVRIQLRSKYGDIYYKNHMDTKRVLSILMTESKNKIKFLF